MAHLAHPGTTGLCLQHWRHTAKYPKTLDGAPDFYLYFAFEDFMEKNAAKEAAVNR